MKKYLSIVAIAALVTGTISCSKDDDNPSGSNNINFTATLNGAAEVPANPALGSGTATAVYNDNTNVLTVTTTYTGLTGTATMAHIHRGAVGVAGPDIFTFPSLTSPMMLTTPALTAQQEADLKANLYYVNIHTAAYTGGEIRGQLIMQ